MEVNGGFFGSIMLVMLNCNLCWQINIDTNNYEDEATRAGIVTADYVLIRILDLL